MKQFVTTVDFLGGSLALLLLVGWLGVAGVLFVGTPAQVAALSDPGAVTAAVVNSAAKKVRDLGGVR